MMKGFGGGKPIEGIVSIELGDFHVQIIVHLLDVAVVVAAGVGVAVG